MNKKFINFILLLILMFITLNLLINSYEVKLNIINSIELWKNNLFPYLFPFFIISDLLINLNFIEIIHKYLKNIMYKLFKINSASSFVFFMSIISGIPSNAKIINTMLKEDKLSEYEASKILLFTHFSNPLFILGVISSVLNTKISIIILCTHYITNIILGLILRNYHPNNFTEINIEKKNTNILKAISTSIYNNINTLILILGVITFFSLITTTITININNLYIKSIISGLLEITNGINSINLLNIDLKLKATITTFILSFGGISSHIQVMSILEDTHIKYLPYFITRIFHGIISSLLTFLLIN